MCVHACTYGIDTRGTLWYSSTRVPLGTAVYRVQLYTGTAVLYSCRKYAWYGVLYSCSAVRGKEKQGIAGAYQRYDGVPFREAVSMSYPKDMYVRRYAEPVRGLAYEY